MMTNNLTTRKVQQTKIPYCVNEHKFTMVSDTPKASATGWAIGVKLIGMRLVLSRHSEKKKRTTQRHFSYW